MARFAPLLALLALIAAAAFVLLRGAPRETFAEGMIGAPAPNFQLARLEGGGEIATQHDFAGRVHVINLFASWCVPCRAEHPVLSTLKQSGAEILGVAYKDSAADAVAFLHDQGDPYAAVALDPEGRFGLELGVTGVPETYVVGADGRIRAMHRGPLTEDVARKEILPALAAAAR
jgi:cytochrome c biogenesis protein CcmG, thiol:disulfide interchange protein DsbE